MRSRQGQQNVQDGHDEHEAPGQGADPFQGRNPFGGVPQEEKENHKSDALQDQGRNHFRQGSVLEKGPAEGDEHVLGFLGQVGHVDDPVGPAGEVGQFGARSGPDPGGYAPGAVLEGGTHFTDHEHIRDEVQGEHEDPGHYGLETLVGIAVDDVPEPPHGGKGHQAQRLPG